MKANRYLSCSNMGHLTATNHRDGSGSDSFDPLCPCLAAEHTGQDLMTHKVVVILRGNVLLHTHLDILTGTGSTRALLGFL